MQKILKGYHEAQENNVKTHPKYAHTRSPPESYLFPNLENKGIDVPEPVSQSPTPAASQQIYV